LLSRLMRFGLPTMPAELSLYSLNFIDRVILVRYAGLAEAGLYSLAVKFAQAVNVLVRGFQLAWPPLAYSIRDDDEARSAYAVIVTWFVACCTFVVTGMWLLSRWIVRLADPAYFGAFKAIGLISTAVTLYALYMVLVVILGRTGRTGFNFPATAAATGANIGLNLALVPPLGIVGAGLALLASYVVVLALMYAFTQRLFAVPYEWGRLGRIVLGSAALVGLGELLMPTSGLAGLAGRSALWLAFPVLLAASGFLTPSERRSLAILRRPRELVGRLAGLRAAPATASPGAISEVYEAEAADEDRR
jgi:O-antigen/teichoic acid export membrane protein